MEASEDLTGRVALVSGAAGGIGAAVVARLRAAGARVAGLDLAPPPGCDCALVADLADEAALAAAGRQLVETLGAPDILVHAAAASVPGGCLDTAPGEFLRLYDVNVVGAVRLLRLFAPAMIAGARGSVLLLSSINARFATPSLAAYAASKAALESLVKTAALELAPQGLRVNAIAPASIDTPLLAQSFAAQPDPAAAAARNALRHPLARLGTAEEVAELALFLVSDRAAWITGAIVPIDGGASVTRRD